MNLIFQNRKMKAKSEAYAKNIDKRGNVPSSLTVSKIIILIYNIIIEKRK